MSALSSAVFFAENSGLTEQALSCIVSETGREAPVFYAEIKVACCVRKGVFFSVLKRKTASLAAIVLAACVLAAAMVVVYQVVLRLLPASTSAAWQSALERLTENPEQIKEFLQRKGSQAPWLFVGAQVLQVIFAPIPGQAVALAGGFVFGFWKGLALTLLGLFAGSAAAMGLSRWLGVRFVRRFVASALMDRFYSLVERGGYTTFFMIFLLPALPDDAVCFLAGLTRLKLLPLSLVCLLGRAPGMAVLSLVGAGLTEGLTPGVKILFGVMMVLSVPLWLFWEMIEERISAFCLRRRAK